MRNGVIKLTNKNFTQIPNNYCINFNDATEFIEVVEEPETDNSQVWLEKSLLEPRGQT